jgi:hypothetical protein
MATQWTAGLSAGNVLPASTLNTIGAAWVDYTPTLTQSATVTKTIVIARYCQFQKTIIGQVVLNATSAGTIGNAVRIGLPIAARTGGAVLGSGYIYDASTNTIYGGPFYAFSGSDMAMFYQTGNPWGISPNLALATSDQISLIFSYEIA